MSGLMLPERNWRFLLRDLPLSVGLTLLILSPPLLERVADGGYFTFDILESFLIPHGQGLVVLLLLIHLLILMCRYFGLDSRWLMILTSAMMLLFCFRGFFSTAGISPRTLSIQMQGWLSLLGQDRINPTTIKRAGAFVFLGFGLLVLPRIVRDTTPVFRACSAFGWALGVITIYRVVPLMAASAEFSSMQQQAMANDVISTRAVDKRVVWIIFDEFDYNRFFQNRNPNLVLPNLDRLRHEAVSAVNAVSPAWATAVSIPALTSGIYLTGTEPAGAGRLLLKRQYGEDIEWGQAQTVFSRLRDSGRGVSILGFVFPYCREFPYAHPCLSSPTYAYAGWWWGIWQALKVVPGLDQAFMRGHQWNAEGMNQITLLQLDQLERHLDYNTAALSFFHFNIPHLPGGRLHGVPLSKSIEALPGYDKNALTVDWMVGEIVKNLEIKSRTQDILLIVSSDHWLRTKYHSLDQPSDQFEREFGNDSAEVHKIPLLIRRMRETSQYVISQPISTVHTARLIEDFLAGRVTDHASIAAWWLDKPYVEPMTPKEIKVM